MSNSYIPNDATEYRQKLLDAIGIHSVDEAFSDIPEKVRLTKSLSLPESRSEAEVRRTVEGILSKNITSNDFLSFLGGGVWSHYVPSAVDAVASRGEFLTSYTPYQPEISQGTITKSTAPAQPL